MNLLDLKSFLLKECILTLKNKIFIVVIYFHDKNCLISKKHKFEVKKISIPFLVANLLLCSKINICEKKFACQI